MKSKELEKFIADRVHGFGKSGIRFLKTDCDQTVKLFHENQIDGAIPDSGALVDFVKVMDYVRCLWVGSPDLRRTGLPAMTIETSVNESRLIIEW